MGASFMFTCMSEIGEGMASGIRGDELCGEVQVTHLPVWQHLKCDEEFAFLSYILFIPSEGNACLLEFE